MLYDSLNRYVVVVVVVGICPLASAILANNIIVLYPGIIQYDAAEVLTIWPAGRRQRWVLMRRLQLRFDFDSFDVRRPFDGLSKVIKVALT